MDLLKWATSAGSWVVEDDYDSEFRYSGRPLPALQGLDDKGCVLYLGTFSKVLFPALRIGYLIVPESLLDVFTVIQRLTDRHIPTMAQAVLADFISEGHLGQHVRRMRELYATRQERLVSAVRESLDDLMEVTPASAGMHLIARLRSQISDQRVTDLCMDVGVAALPLSYYSVNPLKDAALVLGYTGYGPSQTDRALSIIGSVVRALSQESGAALSANNGSA